ncbi:MAG TPA: FliM/FliN family flagellar motor switch protein [Bryobacteraceae bacterium]|jgi:flagellar motor switch protein FliN/FliY
MKQNTNRFLEIWVGEFSRAVEVFAAEPPAAVYAEIEASGRAQVEAQLAGYLWWQGTVGSEENFVLWVGAEPACWSALGNGVDKGNDAKQTYLEMVEQATQGAAAAVSSGFATPLRCRDGSVGALTSLETLELAEIKITFRNAALPPVILAIEPAAANALEEQGPAGKRQSAEAPGAELPGTALNAAPNLALNSAPNSASKSPMLDRLMDLQLPVSVLLGRAVLSVREVLKICPGSVIELDRQIEDHVEVVVHGTVVARGEIVSVRGNYGVRIKEVISRQDRIALKDAA